MKINQKLYLLPDWVKAIGFYGGIAVIILFTVYVPPALKAFGIGAVALGYMAIPAIIFAFIYGLWARMNTGWTIVNQNEMKARMFLGELKDIFFTSDTRLFLGTEVVETSDLTHEEIIFLENEKIIKIHSEGDKASEIRGVGTKKWKGVVDGKEKVFYIEKTKKKWFKRFGGLRFVGLFPFYTIRNNVFPTWREKTGETVTGHDENVTDKIYAKRVGYVRRVEAVDAKNIPVWAELLVVGEVVDMNKFIIATKDGLDQGLDTAESETSHYVKTKEYIDLNATNEKKEIACDKDKEECVPDLILGGKDEVGSTIWERARKDGTLAEIQNLYGLRFIAFKIFTPFRPINKKDEDILIAPFVAEQNKKADIHKAEGEKQVSILRAEGNAEAQTITMSVANNIYEALKPIAKGNSEIEKEILKWSLDVVRRNPYITTGQARDIWINGISKDGSSPNITEAILGLTANNMAQGANPPIQPSRESQGGQSATPPKDYRRKTSSDQGPSGTINNPNSIFHGMDAQKVNSAFGKKKKVPDEELDEDELEVLRKEGLRE